MDKRKVLIGVAWPYVNGNLHIGHLAGYLLPADISARFHRLIGDDVLMVSGSDCFGTPITVEADKKGVTPLEVVNEYHEKDVKLFTEILGLSYDLYTKTNHPNHIKITQELFLKLLEQDYIFIDSTQQYYSPSENKFLPDRYVIGKCPFCGFDDSRSDQCDNCGKLIDQGTLINPKSNLTKQPVELKETEHYFLDWPKLQPFLQKYIEKKGGSWKEWVKNETSGWLREGLKPRAITRDLDWGVPLPVDQMPPDKVIKGVENKRIYVWFDAVIGYLSASIQWSQEQNKSWEAFWHDGDIPLKHYYFMGKDNLVFHTLFWPGQLHGYDEKLHLPDVVSINMFLNFKGKQFSKSRGVVIDTEEIVKKYGNNPVRFYLTLIMPEYRDSSFTWEDFEEKVNGILIATLGNFIHRILSIAKNEKTAIFQDRTVSVEVDKLITKAFEDAYTHLENCEFKAYLDSILEIAQYGNKVINEVELWSLKGKDEDAYAQVLYDLMLCIVGLGYLMSPLLPEASVTLLTQLGIKEESWPEADKASGVLQNVLKTITLPTKPEPLFQKIEVIKE